jgi:hypothetical protein
VFFPTAGIDTVGDIEDGATRIELTSIPANMYTATIEVNPANNLPAVGKGQRIVLDPAGQNITVQIKDFVPETNILILERPIRLVNPMIPIPDGSDVQMALLSPVVFLGDTPKKVQLVATVLSEDDRGVDLSALAPALVLSPLMSPYRDGPFHVPGGGSPLQIPNGIDLTTAAAGPGDRITSASWDLPPLGYLMFEIESGLNGSVFGLELVRSEL